MNSTIPPFAIENVFPEPTELKIGPRRILIALKRFLTEDDFMEWQREEPREIYEVSPKAMIDPRSGSIRSVIFVTYNGGVIE